MFSKGIGKLDRRSSCKKCINKLNSTPERKIIQREKNIVKYQKNKEDICQEKENNIQKYLFKSAKGRAKLKNVSFNIELSDVIVPKFCPLLGIEMKYNRNKLKDDSFSLDKIDPNKGYEKNNVWVISVKANRIKNNATVEELRQVLIGLEQKINSL